MTLVLGRNEAATILFRLQEIGFAASKIHAIAVRFAVRFSLSGMAIHSRFALFAFFLFAFFLLLRTSEDHPSRVYASPT